jgi:RNA polymerase sigma-70 factor (sigma-E family)
VGTGTIADSRPSVTKSDQELAAFCADEYPRLVKVIGMLVSDVHLAEDLAQEALIRACRRWDDVHLLESPGGWVHRVGVNLALSALRSRRTRRQIDTRIEAWPHRSVDHGPSDALAMRQAVAGLPRREREVLVLRYLADYSVADVAATLRCPEGTVKTLARRALERLRESGWAVED